MYDSISHSSVFFIDVVKDARAGNLALPNFQRPIVWDEDNVIALLDSIWRGYPIGYLLLWGDWWRGGEVGTVRGFRGGAAPQTGASLVLDGQQRIQALVDACAEGSGYAYEIAADRFVKRDNPRVVDGFLPCYMLVDWMAFMRGLDPLWERDPAPPAPVPAPPAPKRSRGRGRVNTAIPAAPPPAAPQLTPEQEAERAAVREMVARAEAVLHAFRDARIGAVVISPRQTEAFAREVFRRINTTGRPMSEADVFDCLRKPS